MIMIPKIQVLYRRQNDILLGWIPVEKNINIYEVEINKIKTYFLDKDIIIL